MEGNTSCKLRWITPQVTCKLPAKIMTTPNWRKRARQKLVFGRKKFPKLFECGGVFYPRSMIDILYSRGPTELF
jgi:hypothetical protein